MNNQQNLYSMIRIPFALFHKLMLVFLVCNLSVQTGYAQLKFNEIMQSNINHGYKNGIFPESWIELYNPMDRFVNVNKYRLGASPLYNESVEIRDVWNVLPSNCLIVSCDKNFGNAKFKLDIDGGNLYLFDESGEIVDSLSYPKMKKPDVSWGKEVDGDKWGWMLRPTPDMANMVIADNFPSKVKFSAEGGVWEHFDPFYVELTADGVPDYYSEHQNVDPSLCIRYTLDGSEPTDLSPIYNEPIYVKSTTVIRAKVFDSTKPLLPSNSVSYINHGRPVDKNVVSIITDSLYFYGKEDGIMGNRDYAQLSYRRPMNFEYFPKNDSIKAINTLCKGRAGGNTSRSRDAYLNLVLYAKKAYGDKHFKSTLWPHLKPNVEENKSLYLRCGGKNSTFIKDAVNMNVASFLNIDYQATDALSVYLNGKYYGLLFMYERTNEDYIWANYDKLEDVDLISIQGFQRAVVKAGTIDEFERLKNFWLSAPHTFEEWQKWIDIEEYTGVMALEIFAANSDFWYNNTRFYKSRVDSSSVWRWIVNDLDVTFKGFYDSSYFEWILEGNPGEGHKSEDYGVQLWRGLMQCEEYKSYFLDKVIAYHGDFLNKRMYKAYADSIYKLTEEEIDLTEELYYEKGKAKMKYDEFLECIEKRSDYFHADLQTFFKLGRAVNVRVNNTNEGEISLYYNNEKLKANSFDGWDFAGRTISLRAKSDDKILSWVVEKRIGNMIEVEQYPDVDSLIYEVPSNVDELVFTPIDSVYKSSKKTCDEINSMTDVELMKSENPIIIYDIYGRVLYSSENDQMLVLPRKPPLIISVDGCVKKIMF